jgi:hypothetical protein
MAKKTEKATDGRLCREEVCGVRVACDAAADGEVRQQQQMRLAAPLHQRAQPQSKKEQRRPQRRRPIRHISVAWLPVAPPPLGSMATAMGMLQRQQPRRAQQE